MRSIIDDLAGRLAREAFRLGARTRGFGYACSLSREIRIACTQLPSQNQELIVMDVGASSGNYVAAILDRFPISRVFAFEPSSSKFKTLENRFLHDSRVSCVNLGFGSRSGTFPMYGPAEGSELSSVVRRDLSSHNMSVGWVEDIELETVDSWIGREAIPRVDILKIDVEGNELEVLRGAREALVEAVQVIQFEFGGTSVDAGTYFRDYWVFLREFGFRIGAITPFGLMPIKVYSESEELMVYRNLVAWRERGV